TPDASELETDDTGADHAETLRHGVEIERAPGIHDVLAVEGRGAQLGRRRAGSENHVLRTELALRSVGRRELDTPTRQEPAVAVNRRDARGLEERVDAVRALLDDARLALLHRGQIE